MGNDSPLVFTTLQSKFAELGCFNEIIYYHKMYNRPLLKEFFKGMLIFHESNNCDIYLPAIQQWIACTLLYVFPFKQCNESDEMHSVTDTLINALNIRRNIVTFYLLRCDSYKEDEI